MSLNWDLADVLLVVRPGLGVLLREITEVKVPLPAHHIKGMLYQHDVTLAMLTLIAWLGQCSSGLSTVKLSLLPNLFVYSILYLRQYGLTGTYFVLRVVCVLSCSVTSDSSWPHGLWPARLLCPWNFSGKNTGVGCHFPLQGIFLTEGSNMYLLYLLYRQADSLLLCHLEAHS